MAEQLRQANQIVAVVSQELMRHRVPEQVRVQLHTDEGGVFFAQATNTPLDRLLLAWFGNIARVLEPGRGFYIWGGYSNLGNYPPALKRCGLYFSQAIVWNKEHPVLTRKDFMGAFELAYYGWREGAAHEYFGPNNATDLWAVKKVNPNAMVHLTEKPVELAVRALSYSSRPGENVLDLFGGSGSTLIGAERTGRRAFLIELDPLYCDVIVKRYEDYTGTKAERVEGALVSAITNV
jgi:DNA modification methylase